MTGQGISDFMISDGVLYRERRLRCVDFDPDLL
jgi:hypothetical protein